MFARISLVILTVCLASSLAPSSAGADGERTKVGPVGGEGGEQFADKELPKGARVAGVKIRGGLYIDGIELLYKTAGGKQEGLGWHGGDGGEEETFLLDDGEFITGITGKTAEFEVGQRVVANVTNKRKSKTYGGDGGDRTFDLKKPGEGVTGFYGCAGAFLDRIGVFVQKKP
jgi:Jacalin-like lectin domain